MNEMLNPTNPASPLNPANLSGERTGQISAGVAAFIVLFILTVFVLVGTSMSKQK